MSMKHCSDTIENRTRYLPVCSAVPQPTASPRASTFIVTVSNLHSPLPSKYLFSVKIGLSILRTYRRYFCGGHICPVCVSLLKLYFTENFAGKGCWPHTQTRSVMSHRNLFSSLFTFHTLYVVCGGPTFPCPGDKGAGWRTCEGHSE
jgi:hypothetical protein